MDEIVDKENKEKELFCLLEKICCCSFESGVSVIPKYFSNDLGVCNLTLCDDENKLKFYDGYGCCSYRGKDGIILPQFDIDGVSLKYVFPCLYKKNQKKDLGKDSL